MLKRRTTWLYLTFLILCAFLLLRLFSISNSQSFSVLSGQYTRKIEIASRRGIIFDRNGNELSYIHNGYITLVTPNNIENISKASAVLSNASNMKQSEILEKILKRVPFKLTTLSKIDEPYAVSYKKYERDTTDFLCHTIGYLNKDGTGVYGLEHEYNNFLANTASGKLSFVYEADAKRGQMQNGTSKLSDTLYSEENGIYLTLDKSLQITLEDVCDEYINMGAAIVCDMNSGEILALCSRPAFSEEDISKYINSKNGEFLNRAFLSFTPGSLFKIIVAAAALDTDIESCNIQYTCEGEIDVSGEVFSCHERAGHGEQNMCDAFKNSCNTYFINLAKEIGFEKITEYARLFGIGEYNYVDLIKTSSGTLPAQDNVYPATIANTSIGQGGILITPLEAVNLIRASVTGVIHEPKIISEFVLGTCKISPEEKSRRTVLSKDVCAYLQQMLCECVQSGTGKSAKSDIVCVAGKTATAQSGQVKGGTEVVHKWFAGYFPAENPEYVAVFFADGNDKNASVSSAFRAFAEKVMINLRN